MTSFGCSLVKWRLGIVWYLASSLKNVVCLEVMVVVVCVLP